MYYSHLFDQDNIALPMPNPTRHPSASLQMLRRENYNMITDGRMGHVGSVNHAPEQLVPQLEDAEELDTLSRPRLTQEQISILEEEFKGKPKPGTDFKKQLAARIGLSLQRVNNWYQNRRAKARHQKPPQGSRCDVLQNEPPPDPDAQWAGQDLEFSDLHCGEDQLHEPTTLSEQLPSNDFISIPSDDLAELCKPYSPNLEMIQAALSPTCSTAVIGNELENVVKAEDRFNPTSSQLPDPNSSLSAMPEWHISHWVTDPADIPLPNDGFMTIQDSFEPYPHALYQNSIEGFSVGDLSCHTFVTNSSSEGEADFVTPPPKTSPMPALPPDAQLRRGSNSSQLADDLNTIRLQQPRSRLGPCEEMLPPAKSNSVQDLDESPAASRPQPADSDSPTSLGLNPAAGKISAAPRVDLASRRKRPRPATLRPEAHRSQSFAGPLTMSPTSKVSSHGLGPSPSVRRIKSTGQNMNVVSGRIQKSGLGSAQMSPRNLQTYLDAAGFPQTHLLNDQNTGTSQAPFTPLTPLSPARLELQPEIWPNYSPRLDSSGWDNGHEQFSNNNFEVGPDVASPPITPFNIDAFPRFFVERPVQDSMYHCPQSAPPQQTTFFEDTSPISAATMNQPGWLVPTMALEGYRDESPMSMRRPNQASQLVYPEPQRHFLSNYLHGVPNLGLVGLGTTNFFGSSPPPQKDLEIQVNLIPKPQGAPQGWKKYTFNHTTPKDFAQALYA